MIAGLFAEKYHRSCIKGIKHAFHCQRFAEKFKDQSITGDKLSTTSLMHFEDLIRTRI